MTKRKVLLVEPAYHNKYPPLGLMKLATYHRRLGDAVKFIKGCDPQAAGDFWDRVYITSLFSYDWKTTVETVRYYRENLFGSTGKLFAGGIAASLMPDRFYSDTSVFPIRGRLNRPGMVDDNEILIDQLPPDYSILKQINFQYAYEDAYIGCATRGCVRKCDFCAVPRLEPEFVEYIDIRPWVSQGMRQLPSEKAPAWS